MKELAKIKQLLNSLSKKELNDLLETIRRETLIKDDIEIENIIKSGQINENVFAFLTANATYIYENDKLVTVNDRYAISTISSCLNDIHISPIMLSKLPKLEIVFNPLAIERIYDGKFNTFTPSPYILLSKEVKKRISLDMEYLKCTYKHIYLLSNFLQHIKSKNKSFLLPNYLLKILYNHLNPYLKDIYQDFVLNLPNNDYFVYMINFVYCFFVLV